MPCVINAADIRRHFGFAGGSRIGKVDLITAFCFSAMALQPLDKNSEGGSYAPSLKKEVLLHVPFPFLWEDMGTLAGEPQQL